ncbi:hypothetical protein [Psychrobacter sp. JCM 18900]|uniref:hypothetical protein n=1 Tax=Psychrobacter sp. JCM 18900 TaxID=1298608 RepID=UPI0004B1B6A9|nr:hypothetical protein [Psychrobacter sp. JCM 18900]
MGAIIARMMLSDENLVDDLDKLNDKDILSSNEKQQIRNALKTSFGEDELKERFELQALPQVDTAVFYLHLSVVQIMQIVGSPVRYAASFTYP